MTLLKRSIKVGGCARKGTGSNFSSGLQPESLDAACGKRLSYRAVPQPLPPPDGSVGGPSGGKPAAMFCARSISCSCRGRSKTASGFFVAGGFGPGFQGGTVGFVLAEAAAGAKAHAAPAPGKITITHRLIRPPINVDVVQNANGDQGANHRGPAITEQGQWNARHGHDANIHSDVDEDVAKQECHHAHRQ